MVTTNATVDMNAKTDTDTDRQCRRGSFQTIHHTNLPVAAATAIARLSAQTRPAAEARQVRSSVASGFFFLRMRRVVTCFLSSAEQEARLSRRAFLDTTLAIMSMKAPASCVASLELALDGGESSGADHGAEHCATAAGDSQ